MKVGIQGIEGSFSEEAAKSYCKKFGIEDFSNTKGNEFLEKPFQAEMLTVYLIRYFSIELINFLAKKRGGKKSLTLSKHLAKHLGVGNATGLGMAPFLVNHQELIHQWIYNREIALSRVFSIKRLDKKTQNKIVNYIHQAFKYSLQWKVDDQLQSKKINELNLDLKKILKDLIKVLRECVCLLFLKIFLLIQLRSY